MTRTARFPSQALRLLAAPCPGAVRLAVVVCLLAFVGCDKPGQGTQAGTSGEDAFIQFSNSGRNYYERGDGDRAMAAFEQARKLQPTQVDAILNLANALLLANRADAALQEAQSALKLDPNQAAGHYIVGCAALRLGQFETASKALQNAKSIDRTINEVSFQLGRAYQALNQHEAAIVEFQEVVRFDAKHPAAYYALSQSFLRAGRQEEAQKALAEHQKVNAGKPAQITNPSAFEKSKYTLARVPFRQAPPDPDGISVRFVDATTASLGAGAAGFRGPVAVVDLGPARNSLVLRESEAAWRAMGNTNGVFGPASDPFPTKPGARYRKALVGDLNNDHADDVIILGEGGSHAFKIATNGAIADATGFANLKGLSATNGALVDHMFTGYLGLLTVGYGPENVRFLRNLGSMYFSGNLTNMTNIGIPPGLSQCRQILVDDWDGDDLLDLILQRDGLPPLLLVKQSGNAQLSNQSPPDWPVAEAIASGDVNNDGRVDLMALGGETITIVYGASSNRATIAIGPGAPGRTVSLIDYDNDGWLDVFVTGDRLRVWRNRGPKGFLETTEKLGLSSVGIVSSVQAADFDNDGDLDLLVMRPDQSLLLLRNEGGNSNHLLKLKLVGNKSNGSGLGVKLEVSTSGLRITRRVQALPTEVGVAGYTNIDSIIVKWFTLGVSTVDVKVDNQTPVRLEELTMSDTSCPYLYVWDGDRFRFVTDILGAAPLGLPMALGRYIEANPHETVWLGDTSSVRALNGHYRVSITEELREVLYLDEVKLKVIDHPVGTQAASTDKLLPHGPFPPSELATLDHPHPLLKAARLDGEDVTDLLRAVDGRKVSPPRLREHQLRGWAEPHGVVLDFGPLDPSRPYVLLLNGWLRFGGAMANMAASEYPGLGYPFPALEVETQAGQWRRVDVEPGAPAGKTKTILIPLEGRLPLGARRLRLSSSFEIHWDQIALWERGDSTASRVTVLNPHHSDLHWRGFGELAVLPPSEPQTPVYDRVLANPAWRIAPGGWGTRYGEVDELITTTDNRLALINSGDELVVDFDASALPPLRPGDQRDFFLYSVGWDKDGDFHVAHRDSFEPLPWHGMNDQAHGVQPRPAFADDAWIQKYNTRWCSPQVLTRSQTQASP
ncbi:MAG: VCBS repeat-containing protein [Verrucomicrobia bacterium]|nr:VCBS repeat-containing protein [Verrucomicrobiota bacterium]